MDCDKIAAAFYLIVSSGFWQDRLPLYVAHLYHAGNPVTFLTPIASYSNKLVLQVQHVYPLA
jgi:hypothetical protein